MIQATQDDQPAIEAFLGKHIATSMFPLSNLRRYGMAGGHARAMRFWVRWADGAITDLLALSEEGMVFPQYPTGSWSDVKAVMAGAHVKGVLGDGAQVAALRAALGLPDQGGLDETDPLYELALADLRIPDTTGFRLRPILQAPRALIVGWRCAYLQEVLSVPGEDPKEKAAQDIENYAEADTHRVLYKDEKPVAMTGFNATLPEAVQIGAVYTPPALRSQGLARRAVAMHLAEARANGVEHAILFAASRQASKAYEAIGFRRIGDYNILVMRPHR